MLISSTNEHSLVRDTLVALLLDARDILDPPTSTQKASKPIRQTKIEDIEIKICVCFSRKAFQCDHHKGKNQPGAIVVIELGKTELLVAMKEVSIQGSSVEGVTRPLH